jgi:hypothetical protein
MLQSIYSRSQTILKRFTSASGSNLTTVYEPGFTSPWDLLPTTRYCGFITDLRLKVAIPSLAEKALPDLDVTASRTARITAVRDLEWTSERRELALYLETSSQPACEVARVSLLNRVPFYHINLIPYFSDNAIVNVAADARLLARIVDAGYGLLKQNDEVIIFGSVKEEVTTLPTEPRVIQLCQPYTFTLGTASAPILPVNANRLQATFVNRSTTAKIYLNYGILAEAGKGICLVPNGGSYEINLSNPYGGAISAIASAANAELSILECV